MRFRRSELATLPAVEWLPVELQEGEAVAGARSARVHYPHPDHSLVRAVLDVDGQLMMSECDMERETCAEAVQLARGHVLVAGLGLGVILRPMAALDAVESITVLEESAQVIELVAGSCAELPKVRVVHADVFEWVPDRRFDFMWFDIWPTRTVANREEMARLAWQYRHHRAPGGVLRHWVQDELKVQAMALGERREAAQRIVRQRGPAWAARFVEDLWTFRASQALFD